MPSWWHMPLLLAVLEILHCVTCWEAETNRSLTSRTARFTVSSRPARAHSEFLSRTKTKKQKQNLNGQCYAFVNMKWGLALYKHSLCTLAPLCLLLSVCSQELFCSDCFNKRIQQHKMSCILYEVRKFSCFSHITIETKAIIAFVSMV